MKIVVEGPQIADYLDAVRDAAPGATVVHVADISELLREVADAEILFAGNFGAELIDAAGQLRWLQTSAAGIDWMARDKIQAKGWQVTNAAGIHAIPVAETAIALLMAVARGLQRAVRSQAAHEWRRPPALFEVFEKTAGIIALGGIGRAIAERLQGLGMRVIAVDVNPKSKPDAVDELRGIDELEWLLGASDVVCMTAPDTPKSHHMMNSARFAQMKQGSIFVNVSRGGLVDTDALIVALDAGGLFGAGLDVIDGEPPDADHPIWDREDVALTPHIGGASPRRAERLVELFVENIRRYKAGEALLNKVNLVEGF